MSPRPSLRAYLRATPAALAIACLLLTGCKDQREPAKPIVDLSTDIVSA